MNIFYLLNLLPFSASVIILNTITNQTTPAYAIIQLYATISYYIAALNSVLPFLLHLKFNKIFFKEFCKIFLEAKLFVSWKPKVLKF